MQEEKVGGLLKGAMARFAAGSQYRTNMYEEGYSNFWQAHVLKQITAEQTQRALDDVNGKLNDLGVKQLQKDLAYVIPGQYADARPGVRGGGGLEASTYQQLPRILSAIALASEGDSAMPRLPSTELPVSTNSQNKR